MSTISAIKATCQLSTYTQAHVFRWGLRQSGGHEICQTRCAIRSGLSKCIVNANTTTRTVPREWFMVLGFHESHPACIDFFDLGIRSRCQGLH